MNRVNQVLLGLMLVLLGVVLGLWSVPFLADPNRFPPQAPPNRRQAAVASKAAEPRPPIPADAAMMGMGMVGGGVVPRPGSPMFSVSTLGRIAGRPIVELPGLLNSPFVQALLELSEKQKEEIRKLNADDEVVREMDARALALKGVEAPRAQESVTAHLNRSKEREALLSQKQVDLARRLLCQLNQEYSFADPQVAAELSLTPGQQAEMQVRLSSVLPAMTAEEVHAYGLLSRQALHTRALARVGAQAVNAPPRLQGSEQAEQVVLERERKAAEAFVAVCEKLRDVLTPEQLRRWDAMQGVRLEPWELDEIRGGLGGAMLVTQP